MACGYCGHEAANFQVTETATGGALREAQACEGCVWVWYDFGGRPVPEVARAESPTRLEGASRFVIARLIQNYQYEHQTVVLQQAGGNRLLQMVCGVFEAHMLDRRLKGLPHPRPLTHDAWYTTITALGGTLQDLVVRELRDGVYYANLRIRARPSGAAASEAIRAKAGPLPPAPAQLVEVDVRPSDALVLAAAYHLPIYIRDSVLDLKESMDAADRAQSAAR